MMYTPWAISKSKSYFDFNFLDALCSDIQPLHIIAEGKISEPCLIPEILSYNIHSIVVGNAIANPKYLASKFLSY
jgi:putative N-acetylmannosamine-6-phosphate epimerase